MSRQEAGEGRREGRGWLDWFFVWLTEMGEGERVWDDGVCGWWLVCVGVFVCMYVCMDVCMDSLVVVWLGGEDVG